MNKKNSVLNHRHPRGEAELVLVFLVVVVIALIVAMLVSALRDLGEQLDHAMEAATFALDNAKTNPLEATIVVGVGGALSVIIIKVGKHWWKQFANKREE